ncbi:ATP-binding cassette domain-containing protein [Methylocystis heyeri]|uniref:ATP-binding cassette domain-containing protein n=2 Tax=Methylocystis heyeri TaxID=391905 RepID=A0A6B8KLJ8_9HYPH|nr:ATP-binding cassette domain-containing protein [Methylocystis heyeri]
MVKSPTPTLSSPRSGAATGRVELRKVSVAFGAEAVLSNVDLTVEAGEFVCVIGPSGSGKSTALNLIAGLLTPASGEVLVSGEPVREPGAERGVVFQNYSLFPWKTALDNVAFGPRMQGNSRAEARRAAFVWLEKVGLSAYASRFPATLSGGMQQRVAIARALINRPAVLLMDEPFGALDAQTRALMQELLLDLWSNSRCTVFFVTHDVEEALILADRVIVLSASPGRILLDLPVRLPRPRPSDVFAYQAFNCAKMTCLKLIRQESRLAFDAPEVVQCFPR